jgi:cytoskeletal protein CcmA (bactofilin family)
MLNIFKKETQNIDEPVSNIHSLAREGNDYFSDELIILAEKLTGNLFCAEKILIERNGVLTGNITAKDCIVNGTVDGDITSLDLLEIKSTAIVRGDIQSALVNIEPGAVINGYITVGEDIEALTAQWNKTKFSTDDYLAAKLKTELAELNEAGGIANILFKTEEKPPVQDTEPKEEEKKKPIATVAVEKPQMEEEKEKPIAAAAIEKPQKEEEANNQRWW